MYVNRLGALLAVAVLAVTVVGQASPLLAQGGRVRLEARMAGGGMKGKARFEQRSDRVKFNYQIEQAVPGTAVEIRATGSVGAVTIGTFTVNALGRGGLDFDTRIGSNVPVLQSGDVISAVIDGNTVMSGPLVGRN